MVVQMYASFTAHVPLLITGHRGRLWATRSLPFRMLESAEVWTREWLVACEQHPRDILFLSIWHLFHLTWCCLYARKQLDHLMIMTTCLVIMIFVRPIIHKTIGSLQLTSLRSSTRINWLLFSWFHVHHYWTWVFDQQIPFYCPTLSFCSIWESILVWCWWICENYANTIGGNWSQKRSNRNQEEAINWSMVIRWQNPLFVFCLSMVF